ncbi:MAG: NigD-like N-terminal domain-containing protein [Alistipes sp.]|jgi:hypothetical protein|nr:NigD-like N-terminal domain-containing protein [Alistipes sp.]MBQ1957999.1 NigD-like N-terminal domain-containing protein [Alistipes sp.]
MKRLLTIILAMLSTMFVSTSCNDDYQETLSAIVTVVDGSYDVSYSIRFGDGKTAYVTNTSKYNFSFPAELEGEQRAIIYYYIEDEVKPGYDYVITLVDAGTVPTIIAKASDRLDTALESYVDKVTIEEPSFTDNKYLTMLLSFMGNKPDVNTHKFMLVYNKNVDKSGMFQDSYPKSDDGYLWLELYHYRGTDVEVEPYYIYNCFKISPKQLGTKEFSEYKGIKILHKPIGKTNNTEILTIKF